MSYAVRRLSPAARKIIKDGSLELVSLHHRKGKSALPVRKSVRNGPNVHYPEDTGTLLVTVREYVRNIIIYDGTSSRAFENVNCNSEVA